MDKISFVIPCFNNEENIDDLFSALLQNEKQFFEIEFEYVMVDDGSTDKTFEILSHWQTKYENKVKVIHLKKNVGSHKAVFQGLKSATGNCIFVMAADLQDPPELSKPMFEEWKKGRKLIFAIKNNPLPFSSKLFHRIMKILFVKSAPDGAFDYVLFDKSLLSKLQNKSIKNCNLFYRIVDLHEEFTTIGYTKQQRLKGKSGWTLSKKISFFFENIFSYSLAKFRLVK